jgi:mannosyl-3-phosphoglycerate phosphatase
MAYRQNRNLVLFTDLDGTLLDHAHYRWEAAREALDAVKRRDVPLVVVTSKTRAEVLAVLKDLGLHGPFVVENGGATYLPARYFPFPIGGAVSARRGWQRVAYGTPRYCLVSALSDAAQRVRVLVRSFSEMSISEVAELAGLALNQARAARQREFDEPFVIQDGDAQAWPRLQTEIHRLGFGCTRGSRFFHVLGKNDKGWAVRQLTGWFRRTRGPELRTAGLGDSPNDIPLLRVVDVPNLVARPGGRYDPEALASVPNVRRAGGVGPEGWNRAVLELLGKADKAAD